MGVRPPTGGGNEPDAIEFGIAALAPKLQEAELAFPADASEIVSALDDPEIPVDAHGNAVPLSGAIGSLERSRFKSEREFLNALHPIFEERRERVASGLFASIRAMLPY